MKNKTFTRAELAEVLVDGVNRATKSHSAGEIQKTLAQLGVFFDRDVVKELLDELAKTGRIAYTVSSFLRNGGVRAGRAYHSLELVKKKNPPPEDPFEGLTEKTEPAPKSLEEEKRSIISSSSS